MTFRAMNWIACTVCGLFLIGSAIMASQAPGVGYSAPPPALASFAPATVAR